MAKYIYLLGFILSFGGCKLKHSPTHPLKLSRIRLIDPYHMEKPILPLLPTDSSRLKQELKPWELLDTLGFCIGHITPKKENGYNYHIPLDSCYKIVYYRVYRVERPNANPFVIVTTPEGDDNERLTRPTGCFFLFERENKNWQLRDIIFGDLTAVDIDTLGNWMPILFGTTHKWIEASNSQTQDSVKDYWVEIRYRWKGKHLQADEVISCGTFYTSGESLEIPKMKKAQLYDPLYRKYVEKDSEMYKAVKLHCKFRAFSLSHRNDPYHKTDFFVQNRWRNGFTID